MKERYIFWQQPLRLTSIHPPEAAAARIAASVSRGRLSGSERLAGAVQGAQFRVWRTGLVNADSVECVGSIHAARDGSAVEATLRYRAATRIQFAGGLLLGVILAGGGMLHWLSAAAPNSQFPAVGCLALGSMLGWIYTSKRLRHAQGAFITAKLPDALA
jgi:hypothetical protein